MTAPQPHHPLSVALRVAVAFVVFAAVVIPLLLVLLCLLPSRRLRLRVGGAAARRVAPAVLRVMGVGIDVANPERIDGSTPAVFVINHASSLDTFTCMAIWPRLACAVGKKEVIWLPLFGPAFVLTGHLRIDRGRSAKAIASMNRLVDTVQHLGLSLWLAPEGTRSRDGQLAPFKKGFAHLAIATGLPVVPVVMHGARELWPTPGWSITPGTVRIEVLEPIPTDGWAVETIDEHVAAVRRRFVEALGLGA